MLKDQETLNRVVREGLEYLRSQPDLAEAEVFAGSEAALLCRLNYTAHIPSNGVEEPKSTVSSGVGVLAVFRPASSGETRLIGYGSEPEDLSVEGVRRALEKARLGAVADPDFRDLSAPSLHEAGGPDAAVYHDEAAMELPDETLVRLGWRALRGALEMFRAEGRTEAVIVGGDVAVVLERIAVGNTRGVLATDARTILTASLTAMLERKGAKGTGWEVAGSLEQFRPEEAGRMAARQALATVGGIRVQAGRYPVVLGRQPVADLLDNLIIPSLDLAMIQASSSCFLSRWGEAVAAPSFSLSDAGGLVGGAASRRVTDEGLPTGRTPLIERGRLVGLLTDHYYARKALADPRMAELLGRPPGDLPAPLAPRNGFRGGYRHRVGISPTNLLVEGMDAKPIEEILRGIDYGLYLGRIWYTYPMHGLAQGDFTATVVGDSYLIREGKLASPLRPNTIRINDNIQRLLLDITAVSKERAPALVWDGRGIVYTPEIAVRELRVDAIAEHEQ